METIENMELNPKKRGLGSIVPTICNLIKKAFKTVPISSQPELDFYHEQILRHYMLINGMLGKGQLGPIYEMKFHPKNPDIDPDNKEMDYTLILKKD